MKTHEEIKKGLEACGSDECHGHHADCPYADDFFCTTHVCGDARAYIEPIVTHWMPLPSMPELPKEDA